MDGERLKKAREAAGLSQASLGKKAGVTQDTIWGIESGKRKPHPGTLRKVAVALGVAPEWLAGEGSEEGPDTAAVLLALIRGREARLCEAVEDDVIDLGMAQSADDLHRDIATVVPMVRAGREDITQALIELKATVDGSYDAAVKKLVGRRASVESIQRNTQAEGGQRAGAKSA